MEYAINKENRRIHAEDACKSEEYFCPACGEKVIPKQGEFNAWHFAHQASSCSDAWHYDMSEWHKEWQDRFPEDNREVVISHDGETHRADVRIGRFVIEFQHSPITLEEVQQRNSFYTGAGYDLIWVFDVTEQYHGKVIEFAGESDEKLHWKHPFQSISCIVPQNSPHVALILQLTGKEYDETFDWLANVDWAIPDGNRADYRTFIVDDYFLPDLFTEDGRAMIMLNKRARFNRFLSESRPYEQKCGRIKGNPVSWYKCKITGDWHNGNCERCKYNLITERRRNREIDRIGRYFYCCYPRIMQELHEDGTVLCPRSINT